MATVSVINPESIIQLEVSGYYYSRVQAMITWYTQQVSVEELNTQIKNMADKQPLSEFGTHLETMLMLVKEIEEKATKQNLVVTQELPDTPDLT